MFYAIYFRKQWVQRSITALSLSIHIFIYIALYTQVFPLFEHVQQSAINNGNNNNNADCMHN